MSGVMQLSVRQVVGICAALFVLALGFLLIGEGVATGAIVDAFAAQPLSAKLAWIVAVIIPVVAVPYAVWLGERLARQQRAAAALELRLDGVRQGAKALPKTQADIDRAVNGLARSDPEDAIGAAEQRLMEAERFAKVQEGRNEVTDLAARVEDIRSGQVALQQRLVPVLEKRRQIEQFFLDLDGRQHDIQRMLAEIAHGDDAAAVDVGLKRMADFVADGNRRCDNIARAAKMLAVLQEDFVALQERLAPFAAANDGVAVRITELSAARERLAGDLDALGQTPDGPLPARVQKFADDKKTLDRRLGEITEQFSRLATLHEDLDGLFAGVERALDLLAIGERGKGEGAAADIDSRIEELTSFIRTTQAKLDETEGWLASFAQLHGRLGELQTQLAPLEAADGGILSLIDQIKDVRERLAVKIKRIEESEEGDLGERVQKFSETRKDLEERVATLTEQMRRLASIRNDIAGLFDKLSSAASAG